MPPPMVSLVHRVGNKTPERLACARRFQFRSFPQTLNSRGVDLNTMRGIGEYSKCVDSEHRRNALTDHTWWGWTACRLAQSFSTMGGSTIGSPPHWSSPAGSPRASASCCYPRRSALLANCSQTKWIRTRSKVVSHMCVSACTLTSCIGMWRTLASRMRSSSPRRIRNRD